ncbi:MAG: hypothetical protein KDK66_03805 [Deltaproteobacteria bacterium]|nr:hypothetical protein [Deltaproteobacteria bacterium]
MKKITTAMISSLSGLSLRSKPSKPSSPERTSPSKDSFKEKSLPKAPSSPVQRIIGTQWSGLTSIKSVVTAHNISLSLAEHCKRIEESLPFDSPQVLKQVNQIFSQVLNKDPHLA